MVTLVEASRLSWCTGLAQFQGNPKFGMQKWLTSATYAPMVDHSSLILTGIDQNYLLQALAFDINKTSSAASETLNNIVALPLVPKSLGWPYVKLYYAALFYAQALLRVWGRSPSYFRTLDLLVLRQTVAAYGLTPPFKIQTSQYLGVANINGPSLSLSLDNGGGGSHDAVWRALSASLDHLESAIAASGFLSKDIDQLKKSLKSARALLTNSGANLGWMSEIRNDINYRQGEGLWYPYTGNQKSSDLCAVVTNALKGDLELEDQLKVTGNVLQRFRAACIFVILLSRGVLHDVDEAGGAKSFIKFGQVRFENAIAA